MIFIYLIILILILIFFFFFTKILSNFVASCDVVVEYNSTTQKKIIINDPNDQFGSKGGHLLFPMRRKKKCLSF